MKLEIFIGQFGITKNFLVNESGKKEYSPNAHLLYFPEELDIAPENLIKAVRKHVIRAILMGQDFQILTFSMDVFKGVKLAIREMKFEGAKCYQYMRNGREVCSDIDSNGEMNIWVANIFWNYRGN